MYATPGLQGGQGCPPWAEGSVGRGAVTACRTGVVAAARATSGSVTVVEDGVVSMRTGAVGAAEGGKKSTTFFGTSGIIRGAAVMTMRGAVFGSGSACVGSVVGASDGCGNSIGISTSVVSGCRSASLSSR